MPIIFIAPIFFGAVHVWSRSVLFLWVLIMVMIMAVRSMWGRQRVVLPGTPGLGLAALGFLGVVLVQYGLVSVGGLGWMWPKLVGVREWLVPGGGAAGGAGDVGLALAQAIVYGLAFVWLGNLFARKRHRERFVRWLTWSGVLISCYGIFEVLTGHQHILWWPRKGGHVSGTFINPDHFAMYLEMVIPMGFGWLYWLLEKERQKLGHSGKRDRVRFWRRLVLRGDGRVEKRLLLLLGLGIMILALLLTAARGGIIGCAVSFVVLGGLVTARTGSKGFLMLTGAALAVGVGYGVQIGLDPMLGKFARMSEGDDSSILARVGYLLNSLPVFLDHWLLGTGLGSFPDWYPAQQSTELYNKFINQMHNDWGELLTDTGVIGFACVVLGYLSLLLTVIRGWWRTNDAMARGLGLGVIGAMVGVGVHSLVDFGLRMPGNALIFVAILALGGGFKEERFKAEGVRVKKEKKLPTEHTEYTERKSSLPFSFFRVVPRVPWADSFLPIVLIVACLFSGTIIFRHFVAEMYCPTERNSTLHLERNPSVARVEKAIAWEPGRAAYWYKLGRALEKEQGGGFADKRERRRRALDAYERAVALEPVNGVYWYRAARLTGVYGDGSLEERKARVDRMMEVARRLRPADRDLLLKIGKYWVYRGLGLPDGGDVVAKELEYGLPGLTVASVEGGVPKTKEEARGVFEGIFERVFAMNGRGKKEVMGLVREKWGVGYMGWGMGERRQ